jgi:DNA-binding GntR family transcriptional regulator
VSDSDGPFRRPMTAQEAVLVELRRLILAGELPPGAPVRQDAIATSLGVSRVPVREALKILEGEGQVVYHPHRGYFITELTMRDVREIYRVRDLLESEAIREGVPKLEEGALGRMRAALETMEAGDAEEVARMSKANTTFHMTLLAACDMPHLLKHIRLLREATDAYRSLYYLTDHAIESVRVEHRAIYEAARAGEVEQVVELATQHREHTVQALKAALGEG